MGLFILDHVMLPFTWPFEFLVGEMKEPSIYIRWCGSNLRGCGYGCIRLGGGPTLGANFYVVKKLMLYCEGLSWIG